MKTKYFINDVDEVTLKQFTQNIIESTLSVLLDEIEEGIEIEKGCKMSELSVEEVLQFYASEVARELLEVGFVELQECGQWQDYRIERVDDSEVFLTVAQEKALNWWAEDCEFKSIDTFVFNGEVYVKYIDSWNEIRITTLRDALLWIENIIKGNFDVDLKNNDVELLAHDIKDLEMIVEAIQDLEDAEC